MREIVKRFIETEIELIQAEAFEDLYDDAYEGLTNESIRELTDVLEKCCEIDLEPTIHKNLLKHFSIELFNFKADKMNKYIYLPTFIRLYMVNLEGLTYDEFVSLVSDYLQDDPDFELENHEGELYLTKRD